MQIELIMQLLHEVFNYDNTVSKDKINFIEPSSKNSHFKKYIARLAVNLIKKQSLFKA